MKWLTSSKQICLPANVVNQSWPWDSQIYPWPSTKTRTLLHQKFKNTEDKRSLIGKIKSFLMKVLFWWEKRKWLTQPLILTAKCHTSKIWCIYKFYQIYTSKICLIKLGFSKFLSSIFSSSSDSFSFCVYIHLWTLFNKAFLFHWKYDLCQTWRWGCKHCKPLQFKVGTICSQWNYLS